MAEGTSGRRRFSDKWGKHELDVLAVLSSAFPQWLTSRQIAQRVKAYADSYGELADQAAKAAFAKQFQRDRAKLAAMGIAIESRQPEYSSKSEGQDFASYRLQLGDEPRVRLMFEPEDMPVLAAANYLARSMSISSEPDQSQLAQHASRTTPRVPQTPIPGLGLDSIAPGLGTQPIPDSLVKVIDSRRFAATVDVDGEHLNVAYTDSDDLAMFVLEHPGATIVSPQEAVDAYHRRLHAASRFTLADESASPVSASVVSPSISRDVREPGDPESIKAQNKKNGSAFQTGSEVDRRLRLMLFLSAHLGEEFSMSELAERFIGKPKNDDELKKFVNIIHKDINTLTTVSDDGEMAGSQFFDIDWPLLDAEGIVSATNSLGLERLAGISPQYLSMLTASVSYLAHSPLLPDTGAGGPGTPPAEPLPPPPQPHTPPRPHPPAPPKHFYDAFFKDIVGVSHRKDAHKEHIVIRARSLYIYKLMDTKPLHQSYAVVKSFGTYDDGEYAEFSIDVEPNNEFYGRILQMGAGLEVVSPDSVRKEIAQRVRDLANLYPHEK